MLQAALLQQCNSSSKTEFSMMQEYIAYNTFVRLHTRVSDKEMEKKIGCRYMMGVSFLFGETHKRPKSNLLTACARGATWYTMNLHSIHSLTCFSKLSGCSSELCEPVPLFTLPIGPLEEPQVQAIIQL